MSWTRNLLIWSQTRYHCATEPDQSRTLAFFANLIAEIDNYIYRNLRTLLKWFRSGLNRGPCACEAHVITTTLRNLKGHALLLNLDIHTLVHFKVETTTMQGLELGQLPLLIFDGNNGSARVWTEDLLRVKQTWWPLHYETWTCSYVVNLVRHQRASFG